MHKFSQPKTIPEKPVFKSFDISTPSLTPQYRRNLPHLRLEEATYFVTYRLADSIPQSVMQKWIEERNNFFLGYGINLENLRNNSKEYNELYASLPSSIRHEYEYLQRRRFYIELDKCHGSCLLKHTHHIVSESIEFFHSKRVWIGDYVVMPNHVHLLVQPFPGVKLEEWLSSIKKYSSRIMSKGGWIKNLPELHKNIWLAESYDRIVRNSLELRRMRRYIANNPGKLAPNTFALKQMLWLDAYTTVDVWM